MIYNLEVIAAFKFFQKLFYKPQKVLLICFSVLFITIVLDGSLLRLWGLQRSHSLMEGRVSSYIKKSKDLERKVIQSNLPEVVEMKIRNQFNLVSKEEMLFIFSE